MLVVAGLLMICGAHVLATVLFVTVIFLAVLGPFIFDLIRVPFRIVRWLFRGFSRRRPL